MDMLVAGFKPDSMVDWRGKIVATVFTYGCNFRCPFCHNFYLVTEKMGQRYDEEEIIARIENLGDWIDGVCITGGEPTMHKDIVDFVKEIRKIKPVKIDTNGSNPDTLRELVRFVDYVAMDIKAPKGRYEELAGVPVNIEKIESSVQLIKKYARDYEFRTTFVPVLKKEDIVEISSWLAPSKRYVIQQFSTGGGTLDPSYSQLKPLDPIVLRSACEEIRGNFEECIVANV